jgi:hypothetical protein
MQYIKNSTFMNFLRRNAKATAKCSRFRENILRSFVNGGADVELARSRPAYTARSPKAWRRFKHYVVGFVGKPTDRMEQNASSCTHALHKPLTGLRKLEVTS